MSELTPRDQREYLKAWREKNKEKIKADRAANYKKNKKAIDAQNNAWAAANPEKRAAISKRYRAKNKDTISERRSSLSKEFRKNNKELVAERNRARNLMHNFGITVEEYEALLEQQDNRCAICNTASCNTGRRFAVDHIHDMRMRGGEMVDVNIGNADAIRGLLCQPCNTSIGGLQDSPELLRKAAHYIEGNEIQ